MGALEAALEAARREAAQRRVYDFFIRSRVASRYRDACCRESQMVDQIPTCDSVKS